MQVGISDVNNTAVQATGQPCHQAQQKLPASACPTSSVLGGMGPLPSLLQQVLYGSFQSANGSFLGTGSIPTTPAQRNLTHCNLGCLQSCARGLARPGDTGSKGINPHAELQVKILNLEIPPEQPSKPSAGCQALYSQT